MHLPTPPFNWDVPRSGNFYISILNHIIVINFRLMWDILSLYYLLINVMLIKLKHHFCLFNLWDSIIFNKHILRYFFFVKPLHLPFTVLLLLCMILNVSNIIWMFIVMYIYFYEKVEAICGAISPGQYIDPQQRIFIVP